MGRYTTPPVPDDEELISFEWSRKVTVARHLPSVCDQKTHVLSIWATSSQLPVLPSMDRGVIDQT